MELDLTRLNNYLENSLDINQTIEIPKDLYKNSSIIELKDVNIDGQVFRSSTNIITLKANLTGIMVLEDSISLDLINYEFSCEIDEELEESLEKIENTLDITEILWQNIMLEVPLKFTNVKNFNEYQGDGWKLVDEDSIKSTNNPFIELKDIIGEE